MKKIFLSNNNKTFKANMHCHTTVSDGKYSPEEIKELYMRQGYSIIAYTDHCKFINYNHLSDENFLAINAIEVDINEKDKNWNDTKTYHLNLYATKNDITEVPPLPEIEYGNTNAINEYIKKRNKDNFLVCYNHPYWSLQTESEYRNLKGLFAMEIYNHGCEVEGLNGYSPVSYDEMLRSGQILNCFSADDNHNHDDDSFGGWIYVNSESLKYDDVINALNNGDFYSSQGPEIYEIFLEKNIITVKCSSVEAVGIYLGGRNWHVKRGNGLTEATFEINENEKYFRIMCRDMNKMDANSNAYLLKN